MVRQDAVSWMTNATLKSEERLSGVTAQET